MRPDKDTYFLQMARLVATRSTCLRRSVGCVMVSALGHVLSTGYNGVPAGFPHCNSHDVFDPEGYPNACKGAWKKSGESLDSCMATHAEMNALLQCQDVQKIDTVYCTASPCITCTKLLMNTSARRILFLDEYPHPEAKDLWCSVKGACSWIKKDVQTSSAYV